MRFIFSIIKNIIAVIAILIIIYIALKYAPFLRDQEWNPISNPPNQTEQNMDNPNNNTKQPQHGKRYSIEDNDIIKNVPTSQIKNVFNMINKKEFMSVSGIGRMGYNDEYLAGQEAMNLLFINSVLIQFEYIIMSLKCNKIYMSWDKILN